MPRKATSMTKPPPHPWKRVLPADGIDLTSEERLWVIRKITEATEHSRCRGSSYAIAVANLCQAIASGTKIVSDHNSIRAISRANLGPRIELVLAAHSVAGDSPDLAWEAIYELPSAERKGQLVPWYRIKSKRVGRSWGSTYSKLSFIWTVCNSRGLCDIDGTPMTEPIHRSPVGSWEQCLLMRSI